MGIGGPALLRCGTPGTNLVNFTLLVSLMATGTVPGKSLGQNGGQDSVAPSATVSFVMGSSMAEVEIVS